MSQDESFDPMLLCILLAGCFWVSMYCHVKLNEAERTDGNEAVDDSVAHEHGGASGERSGDDGVIERGRGGSPIDHVDEDAAVDGGAGSEVDSARAERG